MTISYIALDFFSFIFRHLKDPQAALEAMLKPKITLLPGHIQSVYVQNILKLYSNILKSAEADSNMELIQEMGKLLQERLPVFVQSADLEVQERVRNIITSFTNIIPIFNIMLQYSNIITVLKF